MEPVSPASEAGPLKRKRDDIFSLADTAAPVAKASKASSAGQLISINYLARQSQEDLPLINKDDSLPNLLQLLASYSSILERHESLASNLGARPLGPILIKRFERCFDSPPKVVASHHKGAVAGPDESSNTITWLEVIEFARSHPTQFTLSTFSEGKRVCQFYYPQKQLRVQISEEDFLFINSGRCQELIPPLPIWEDEEKEVGTCDVLDAKLKELTNAADVVAARTRQLSHRLKGRKAAILERRAEGGSGTPAKASAIQTTTAPPSATGTGFTAVNSVNGRSADRAEPQLGSSAAVRNDLLRHFESLPHNQTHTRSSSRQFSVSGASADGPLSARHYEQENGVGPASTTPSLSPVPADFAPSSTTAAADPSTKPSSQRPGSSSEAFAALNSASGPALKHNFSRPLAPALESSQPFRPICQAHMDGLPRGARVLPPCDRCRRLRMDCVKNLTSCAGCTKKHARCHWRDVEREEVVGMDAHGVGAVEVVNGGLGESAVDGGYDDESDDDESNPLEDLEALGAKEEREGLEQADDGMGLGIEAEEERITGWRSDGDMRGNGHSLTNGIANGTDVGMGDEGDSTHPTTNGVDSGTVKSESEHDRSHDAGQPHVKANGVSHGAGVHSPNEVSHTLQPLFTAHDSLAAKKNHTLAALDRDGLSYHAHPHNHQHSTANQAGREQQHQQQQISPPSSSSSFSSPPSAANASASQSKPFTFPNLEDKTAPGPAGALALPSVSLPPNTNSTHSQHFSYSPGWEPQKQYPSSNGNNGGFRAINSGSSLSEHAFSPPSTGLAAKPSGAAAAAAASSTAPLSTSLPWSSTLPSPTQLSLESNGGMGVRGSGVVGENGAAASSFAGPPSSATATGTMAVTSPIPGNSSAKLDPTPQTAERQG